MDFATERHWPQLRRSGCSARRHSRPSGRRRGVVWRQGGR